MYVSTRPETAGGAAPQPAAVRRARLNGVARNVVLLGIVSLLTDVSSEMVASTLPLYLTAVLGFTPLQFGVLDGLYQGASALVRLAGGVIADRFQRHKQVAAVGYGLSALCKPLLLAVGASWTGLLGVLVADRVGKGLRTAPRDALISLSTPPERLGTAFGVHRALDTAGAMLGPLVAFGILALGSRAFDSVFVVSACFAIAGLVVLLLLVENRHGVAASAAGQGVRAAFGLLRDRRVRGLVLAAALLALPTISDGFVYLTLQRRLELPTGVFPLLSVGTAAVYLLLAVPAGRLADRWGRGRVLLAGSALLLLVDGLLVLPGLPAWGAVLAVGLLGAFYAATDGVLAALASTVLPESLRSSGLALIATVTAVARLGASVLFGATWTWSGAEPAIAVFAVALLAALPVSAVLLRRTA